MSVPMLDLKVLFKSQEAEIRAAMDRVLESQNFINGPEVDAFEAEVAAFLEASVVCVGCSNGSAALVLALMALGVGPGDEVVVPTYSFFSTASSVVLVGATPVWVDVEPGSCNIDPEQLADKLSDRTRAVIPVHLFGRAADLGAIQAVLERAGRADQVVIVEDAAQALSARFEGRRACTIGALSTISFFPSKNLGAFGDAGMVVSTDPKLAETVRVLSRHGARVKYFHDLVGLNSRLDALQAAILRVKLVQLDAWSEARRVNAARYRALFAEAGLEAWVTMPVDDGSGGRFFHIYNQFNLRAVRRDALEAHLSAAGIGTAVYYPRPLHVQACFEAHGGKWGDHPVSEDASQTSLAIPIFPGLTEDQQVEVVEAVKTFYVG